MDADTYQLQAARTLIAAPDFHISDDKIMIVWNAIGLAGESGELCDEIKKGIFHQQGVNIQKVSKEIGDCLWYLSALCTKLGLSLSSVMDENIEKIKARYPDGFDPARCMVREGNAG